MSLPDNVQQARAMSPGEVRNAMNFLTSRHPVFPKLPGEIKDIICTLILTNDQPTTQARSTARHVEEPKGPRGDPSIPLSNGKAPILNLPVELGRAIFAHSVLNKLTVKPRCENDMVFVRASGQPPKHNKTSDLMVLCKKIKTEVATTVYQERTFEIHVHEGVIGGGIEVLDAGRQLLQYISDDMGIDTRFVRFGDSEEFGFDRLKKINIIIFPKTNTRPERHTTMNTYFMCQALAHMLERGCEKDSDRIISINITFHNAARTPGTQQAAGRLNIMRNEIHWWDFSKAEPLSSEIYGMSDIELILRPFSILRKVHNVEIELPPKVNNHAKTLEFVEDLKTTMTTTSNTGEFRQDYSFEMQANAIKHDLFESTFQDMFGRNGQQVGDLSEMDMHDLGGDEADAASKHDLSFSEDGDSKRQKAGHSHLDLGDDEVDESGNSDDSGISPPPKGAKGKGKQRMEWKETFYINNDDSTAQSQNVGTQKEVGTQTPQDGPPAPTDTTFDTDGALRAPLARSRLFPPRYNIATTTTSSGIPATVANQTTTPTPLAARITARRSGSTVLNNQKSMFMPGTTLAGRPPAHRSLRSSTSDPTHLALSTPVNAQDVSDSVRTLRSTTSEPMGLDYGNPQDFRSGCPGCGAQFAERGSFLVHQRSCGRLPDQGFEYKDGE